MGSTAGWTCTSATGNPCDAQTAITDCATGANGLAYIVTKLQTFIADSENTLQDKITKLNNTQGTQLNQAALLEVQVAVQGWAISSGVTTNILQAVGSGLKTITQNIR